MRTIALIEDDRDTQELLRYRLQREGYRLAVHSTGRDAIPFLLQRRPALALLDVMLAHQQGWEICKAARAHPQLSNGIGLRPRDGGAERVRRSRPAGSERRSARVDAAGGSTPAAKLRRRFSLLYPHRPFTLPGGSLSPQGGSRPGAQKG